MPFLEKGDLLSGRYEVVELLGEGAMGRVYLSRDNHENADVAIKVLSGRADTADIRSKRFEREIQSLRRLAHPYILHYLDHGQQGEVMYLVTELLRGGTLEESAGNFLGQADKVLLLGSRLASAFAAAHRLGVIHRDIKPSNIVLTREGEPRILDYGLARWVVPGGPEAEAFPTIDGLTRSNVVIGTVPYMSPEQLRGEPATGGSDIFSLGVALYEVGGGRRPYEGNTIADLLLAIESGDPPALGELQRELAGGAGTALNTVLRRALHPVAAMRFQTMEEFGEALDRCLDLHAAVPQGASMAILLPPSLTTADHVHGSLFGRDSEIELLGQRLELAWDGQGTTILLAGPAGRGRTRLAAEVMRMAHRRGFLCLAASAPSSTSEAAEDPLDAWLERAAEVFPGNLEIEHATAKQVDRSSPDDPDHAPADPRPDRIITALHGLASRLPLLLLLENVHRASPTTREVLERLASFATTRRVLVVLTLRTDAPASAAAEPEVEGPEFVERIDLLPLEPADLRAMIEEAYPGLDVEDSFVSALRKRSGGNPFFARTILRLLEEQGRLARDGGDWRLDQVQRLPAAPEARIVLRERMAHLGPEALELIRAAAILGERFRLERLAQMVPFSREDVETHLREIARSGRILVPAENDYRFDQPLSRETLLEDLDPDERKRLHLKAAETLGNHAGSAAAPRTLAAVARHFLEAGCPDDALPFCIRAGELFGESGAPEEAVSWLDRARIILERRIERVDEAARAPLREELASVDLSLAEHLDGIGRHSDALEIFDKTRSLAITAELEEVHVRTLIGIARASLARGDVLHAQRQAREAWRTAKRRRMQHETALALSVEAHALSRADDNEEAEDRWSEAAMLLQSLGHEKDAAEIYSRLGGHHFRLARFDEARECYEKAAARVEREKSPRLYARILNAQAGVVFAAGNPAEALPLFKQALTLRAGIGSRRGMATSLHNIAYCQHALGNRQKALELFEQVLALREEIGEEARRTDSQRNYAEVLLDLGRLEEALDQVSAAVATKRRLEDLTHVPPCLNLVGEIELELGCSERAREVFAEVIREFPQHPRDTFVAGTGMARVESMSGQNEQAAARVKKLLADIPSGATPLHRLIAWYEWLRLVRAGERPAEEAGAAGEALAAFDLDQLTPEPQMFHARARAELARIEDRGVDARVALDEAREIAEKLSAVEHVWRIDCDLGLLSSEGSEERTARLDAAWRIVEEQARLIIETELRESYLNHRERTALRQLIGR